MPWEPTASDIAWQQNLVNSLKQGGIWAVPCNGGTYKLDHETKVATRLTGQNDETDRRIRKVFNAIGWQVINAEERN